MKRSFSKFLPLGVFLLIFLVLVGFFQGQSLPQTPSVLSSSTLASRNHVVEKGSLGIIVIDVGQGDSILVISPSRGSMLIDTGDNFVGYALSNVTKVLKDNGIKDLDYLVITHPHQDHIGNILPILSSYKIDKVISSGVIYTNNTYEKALTEIRDRKIPFQVVRAGDKIDLDKDMSVDVLAPSEPLLSENINNTSVVLKLTYKGFRALLTGDAESESETRQIKEKSDLAADVIKIGHHGSSSSTSDYYLSRVSPRIAIISVGKGNPFNHPSSETIKKLEDRNINTYTTENYGTVSVLSNGETFEVKADR